MTEPETTPVEDEPVQPTPWTDNAQSITADENIAAALSEEQVQAINTISEKTTYIRSNIALTNGADLASPDLEHIPNLYTAVKTAFDFAIQGSRADFGENGIKTDRIAYSTDTNGDIVLVVKNEEGDKSYSLVKIIEAIETLDARTQHMISSDNDKTIDIVVEEEPEDQPEEEEPEPTP